MDTLSYDNLIENVKSLSIEEKEELKFLINRYLSEEKREKIYKNFKDSLIEYNEGKLKFSSELTLLKELWKNPTCSKAGAWKRGNLLFSV